MNRKHWNAIAKMVANAAASCSIEDIGRKNVNSIILHEFMIDDEPYQIRKEPVDWEGE